MIHYRLFVMVSVVRKLMIQSKNLYNYRITRRVLLPTIYWKLIKSQLTNGANIQGLTSLMGKISRCRCNASICLPTTLKPDPDLNIEVTLQGNLFVPVAGEILGRLLLQIFGSYKTVGYTIYPEAKGQDNQITLNN